jgi:hypothetical protein
LLESNPIQNEAIEIINMENEDKKNFAGKNGFIWWVGTVEDRKDPLKLGRCRVRCVGWHADDKMRLPTKIYLGQLPSLPTNNPNPYAPKEGDMVFGFFVDGENAQEPVMLGVLPNIPLQRQIDKKHLMIQEQKMN